VTAELEQLLREGLNRLAAVAEVPDGLVRRARRHRRRTHLARGSLVTVVSLSLAAAMLMTTAGTQVRPREAGPGRRAPVTAGLQVSPPGPANGQRGAAAVLGYTKTAVTSADKVMLGRTTSQMTGRAAPHETEVSVTWAYHSRHRFVEYSPDGMLSLTEGTAMIGGRLRTAYVTYFGRRWSGGGPASVPPASGCGQARQLGGGVPPATDWPAFLTATLGCGVARISGRVWVDGVHTIEIRGVPFTSGTGPSHAAGISYALYVNPASYLPVRVSGSASSYSRATGTSTFTSVTSIQWLPPTPANVAQTLVTVPPGFRRVRSAPDG
jgi:hypothetical protein